MYEELELGERVIAAFEAENTGNVYQRQGVICDRWFDGIIEVVDILEQQQKEMYEK